MTYNIKFKQKLLSNESDSIFNKAIIKDYNITANCPKEAIKYLKQYLKQPIEILEVNKVISNTPLKITTWCKIIRFFKNL